MLNGVAYQLVHTLFEVVRMRAEVRSGAEQGQPRSASLVVEPLGGSDLETIGGNLRTRIEIKARTGRTWSLNDWIDQVLPSLYGSSVEAEEPDAYLFVTDGSLGTWEEEVYVGFFRDLRVRRERGLEIREALTDQALPCLASSPRLAERLQKANHALTERGLFAYIAETLAPRNRDEREVRFAEDHLYRLLSALEIRDGQTPEILLPAIRRELTDRGVPLDRVESKIEELCYSLLKRAAQGAAWVDPVQFLGEHGVEGIPLSHWPGILRWSRHALHQVQRQRGYDRRVDSRAFSQLGRLLEIDREAVAPDPGAAMRVQGPVVLLGATGQGKSWAIDRAADELSQCGEVIIVLDTTGDVERDGKRAAEKFCTEIWRHDTTYTLRRLAERVANARGQEISRRWMTLFIDGLQDVEYVRALNKAGWHGFGVRTVLAVTTQHGEDTPPGLPSDCLTVRLRDFTLPELLRFLHGALPASHSTPPEDVCELLRRPFLARLFVDITSGSGGWVPTAEYELLERYWRSRLESCPIAGNALAQLAAGLIDRWAYPWSTGALRNRGLEDQELTSLLASGLLVQLHPSEGIRLWHDRLLQWAAAEGLVSQVRDGVLDEGEFLARAAVGTDGDRDQRIRFGYVPMDALWLASDPQRDPRLAEALLARFEGEHTDFSLLGSLGERIVPIIVSRLRRLQDPYRYRAIRYLEVLESLDHPSVAAHAVDLLQEPELSLQRIAVRILKTHPSPRPLDRLWELYQRWSDDIEAQRADGNSNQQADRRTARIHDQAEVEEALGTCAREDPAWLEHAIQQASPEHLPALLYPLPKVEGGEAIWKRVKQHAIVSIEPAKERAVAYCIAHFGGQEEVGWLTARLNHPHEFVAPWVRRAMMLLSPEEAAAPLTEEALFAVFWWKGRWLPWMLLERPDDVRKLVATTREIVTDLWSVATLFRGREPWMPVELLEALLDETADTLRRVLEQPGPDRGDPLYRLFDILARASHPDLLPRFWKRQGTALEVRLAEWLVREGPNDSRGARLTPERGRALLCKIAGSHIAEVASAHLREAQTFLGRRPAVHLALRRANRDTLRLLSEIAHDPEPDTVGVTPPFPVSQRDALEALAVLGEHEALVSAVLRLGTQIPPDLPAFLDGRRLEDPELGGALAHFEPPRRPTPGAVVALALSGRREMAPKILEVLHGAAPDSELALASVFALEVLGDSSFETVEALTRALEAPDTHYAAWRALLSGNRSPEALQPLLAYLETHSGSGALAFNLLANPSTRDQSAQILWRSLDVEHLREQFGGYLECFSELDSPEADEILFREAFQSGRRRMLHAPPLSAIRGLMKRAPVEAFQAAAAQLASGPPGERPDYPALLLDLNTESALPLLAEVASTSSDLILLRAIGEALDDRGREDVILDWLGHDNPRLRAGACLACAPLRWSAELDAALLGRLRDASWRVRAVASPALMSLRQEKLVRRLLAMLKAEEDTARRWAIVDAALDLGDPGVGPRHSPENWFPQLLSGLPYVIRKHAVERINKRREELRKRLEREMQ